MGNQKAVEKKNQRMSAGYFLLVDTDDEESSDDPYYDRRTIHDKSTSTLHNFFSSIGHIINSLRERYQERMKLYRQRHQELQEYREFQRRLEYQEFEKFRREYLYRQSIERFIRETVRKTQKLERYNRSIVNDLLSSVENTYQYETTVRSRRSFWGEYWGVIFRILFIISIACIMTTYFRLKESAETTTSVPNSTTDITTENTTTENITIINF